MNMLINNIIKGFDIQLDNRDIVNIERYLESCVKAYDIPYLNLV